MNEEKVSEIVASSSDKIGLVNEMILTNDKKFMSFSVDSW